MLLTEITEFSFNVNLMFEFEICMEELLPVDRIE